ncbi:sugar phosphate isomerase/epimerase family protein [Streptomyces sp. NPDC058193]|uniref:sugar phosphate isomerase/epimerase family protein n=1 Tax=Streptomyces sp. NPDC058193 TaxID=3346373 RepID=UPI0036EF830F
MPTAPRPVTLFTQQWADMPFQELCERAAHWGYDGLEIAVCPRHLDLGRAADDPDYLPRLKATLDRSGLRVFTLGAHLVGQAVCDPIDQRHRSILPDRVWGDGEPEGVRRRAAREIEATARAAAALGAETVVGFTGSSIWHALAMFPPISEEFVAEGFSDFARRWHPILDVFDQVGVRFALEVHPTEIAYDYWTARRALDAVGHRPAFGLNLDPSHLVWQGIDPAGFLLDFRERIYHVDFKDTKLHTDGRNGVLGSHLPWADPRRGWDFVSVGHGDIDFESCVRVLNSIGYTGPVSVEWEDAGYDRLLAAPDALAEVRRLTGITPTDPLDFDFGDS